MRGRARRRVQSKDLLLELDIAGLQCAAGACEDESGRMRVWSADARVI